MLLGLKRRLSVAPKLPLGIAASKHSLMHFVMEWVFGEGGDGIVGIAAIGRDASISVATTASNEGVSLFSCACALFRRTGTFDCCDNACAI